MTTRYALIGAAGYVAPRHMRAIAETGGELVCALDPSDSVGVLDSYFPEAKFFTELERFDRHLYKLKRRGAGARVDTVAICSPNYLHDAHVRFALRSDADAICEKPLVLNPWNVGPLREMEQETGRRVHAILQLRLHPSIEALRQRVAASPPSRRFAVDLTYIAARGAWYQTSWKSDRAKAGGVSSNIGVHFFDMLAWIFGAPRACVVHHEDSHRAAGRLELERADVRWLLSVEAHDLPEAARARGLRTYRALELSGEAVDFSGGFDDLHSASYRRILAGAGFTLQDVLPCIELIHQIREAAPVGLRDDAHPLLQSVLA